MTKEELKLLRRKLELTQDEMAINLGVSRAQYARYEAGNEISKPVNKLLQMLSQSNL